MRRRSKRWWRWRDVIRFGRIFDHHYLVSITPHGVGLGWRFVGTWFSWRGKRGGYYN